MAGYALARRNFPGWRLLFVLLLSIMSVPGVVLLVPKFLARNTFGMFEPTPAWWCRCWWTRPASSS